MNKNYRDLETHFRQYHFLCKDEECLTKKFVVFLSEDELKRHTWEHEYCMCCNAALEYSSDGPRQRGCSCQHHTSDDELSLATQASLETANAAPSSNGAAADHGEISNDDTHFPPLESLAITDSAPSSRHLEALSQISFPLLPVVPCSSQQNGQFHALSQTSFPLLAVALCSSQQNSHSDVLLKNTMEAHLRLKRNNNKMNLTSSAPAWEAASYIPAKPAIIRPHTWPSVNSAYGPVPSSRQNVTAIENRPTPSNYATAAKARQSSAHGSSFSDPLITSRNWGNQSWTSHSTSSRNLSECVSLDPFNNNFPPVSAVQTCKLPATVKKVQDMYTTNKSLVEKIRVALGFDENRYSIFKAISSEYRQGLIDAETYLAYMEQYGLLHLVLDLAGLLPDARKQKELVETYNANLVDTAPRENGWNNDIFVKNDQRSKKDRGKTHDSRNSISKHNIAGNIVGTVKELPASHSRSQEDFEVLSKEGYRVAKGKSVVVVDDSQEQLCRLDKSTKLKSHTTSLSSGARSSQNSGNGNGKHKQQKKSQSISSKGRTAFA